MSFNQASVSHALLKVMYYMHKMGIHVVETEDAYKLVEKVLKVPAVELNMEYAGGDNVFRTTVRAAKYNVLKVNGFLIENSRAKWVLTQKGIEECEKLFKLD